RTRCQVWRSQTGGPSSTYVVRRRDVPPTPPHDDQNISDSSRPMAPTTIRITPIVLMSTPETVAFTAQVRIAPAAIRIRLTTMPIPSNLLLVSPDGRFRLPELGHEFNG